MPSRNSTIRNRKVKEDETGPPVDTLMKNLCHNMREGRERAPVNFNDFLHLTAEKPALILRNIFQVFFDFGLEVIF